ncbi:hypothetical protein C0992_013330 [Termitomyces sp. T32_za158]|nr:hypothetical protein C0992_013330 [Termitomyces sp. T32_za158]
MSNPALYQLPMEKRFDGSNWSTFKTIITEAARGRGLLDYFNGTIADPGTKEESDSKRAVVPETSTTWWGASNPTPDEWKQWDAYARSMIILNVINPIGAGVNLDGTAAQAWESLTKIHNARTDLGLLQAEEELNSIKYRDGANIESHF